MSGRSRPRSPSGQPVPGGRLRAAHVCRVDCLLPGAAAGPPAAHALLLEAGRRSACSCTPMYRHRSCCLPQGAARGAGCGAAGRQQRAHAVRGLRRQRRQQGRRAGARGGSGCAASVARRVAAGGRGHAPAAGACAVSLRSGRAARPRLVGRAPLLGLLDPATSDLPLPCAPPSALKLCTQQRCESVAPPSCPQSAPGDLAAYGVKERLLARWREVARASATGGAAGGAGDGQQGAAAAPGVAAGPDGDFASPQQRALFALLSCYADLLLPCRPYPTAAGAHGPCPTLVGGWSVTLLH